MPVSSYSSSQKKRNWEIWEIQCLILRFTENTTTISALYKRHSSSQPLLPLRWLIKSGDLGKSWLTAVFSPGEGKVDQAYLVTLYPPDEMLNFVSPSFFQLLDFLITYLFTPQYLSLTILHSWNINIKNAKRRCSCPWNFWYVNNSSNNDISFDFLFANGPGRPGFNSRLRQTKDFKKWYLIPPCLTLSNIRYISRVKWSNPGKGVAPSPTPRCSSY